MKKYDFGGWATKFNIQCADGVTIKPEAFKHMDGLRVPLVYGHVHDDQTQILGHADLEWRPEGVYAYGSFNNNENGQIAKEMVRHEDLSSLSIWANELKRRGTDIMHGVIKEVSLVLSGANKGALIEGLDVMHSDKGDFYTEALIFNDEVDLDVDVIHSEAKENKMEKTHSELFDQLSPEEQAMVADLVEASVKNALDEYEEEIENVLDDLEEEVLEDDENEELEEDDEDIEEEDDEGDKKNMAHSIFENVETMDYISHEDVSAAMQLGKQYGSLKAGFEDYFGEDYIAHDFPKNEDQTVQKYGMANIGYLYPDARAISSTPLFYKRNTGWVAKVMESVHRTPFSKIKSVVADITADEARAKGYIKGKEKIEEVFSLLKRTTQPQTIYKKQKIDRDDILDITDFDVIAFIKSEMRIMLDEEIARAILIGDGRLASSDDKIQETNIRPIAKDADLYAPKVINSFAANATATDKAKGMISNLIRARKNYQGSGDPVLFVTEDRLADMLLIEDGDGRYMYKSVAELATTIRASEIISVPPMEGVKVKVGNEDLDLAGILVNLNDYNIGADRGGEVNMFDDFDIDFNAMKYLIETRCSGALTLPKSALVVVDKKATA